MTMKTVQTVALAAATILALTACAPEADSPTAAGEATASVSDSSTPLEMWVRAASATQSQALVDAYNAIGDQQVALTIIPTDNYLQRVGIAAGSEELPCLMASDVIYMPNFVKNGLYTDITDRVLALDFSTELAPGHIALASNGGAIFGVPHTVAVSALFQNNVLLERAGIDPDVPIETLDQLAENALAVAQLGPEISGLYYTGNNAGSISFTHFPSIWASGGEAITEDGTGSLLASDESVAVFEAFNRMFKSGATPESVRAESGATRNDVFATGNVGYVLSSNGLLQSVEDSDTLQIGVQGIPGVTGGVSTFTGGDAIGISSNCDRVDSAWGFLEWSLGVDAQVQVFGEINQLTVRADLADNEFTASDPRLVILGELVGLGSSPKSLNYGQTFNDPQGPALGAFQAALFGDEPRRALEDANDAISSSLAGN